MAQIVGKYLRLRHPRAAAQSLHLPPDPVAGERSAVPGAKDRAGGDFLLPGELQQLPAQLPRQQDGADLPLQPHLRPAAAGGLHREVAHLRDPDAGGADGLHEKLQPLPAPGLGGLHQPPVLLAGQLPLPVPEDAPLHPQKFHPALLPAQEAEESVEGGELGVDRGGREPAGQQVFPPARRPLPRHRAAAHERREGPHVPQVLLHRRRGALLLPQRLGVGRDLRCA